MATYYIKSDGSDSNSGTSDSLAWATIAKANSFWSAGSFAPGDSICFRCGDTFYGQINVAESGASSNPITITSYGTGNKPIITGFTTISGSWTNEGGNIYSIALSSVARTNMVVVNGTQYGMGRYPQLGTNLTYTTGTITSITDPELPASPNWTGAEVVINKYDWVLDRYVITSHSGTTINYSNPYGFEDMTPGSNRYYFIQNDIRCLTATNNWYHNYSTGRFYIYGDPSAKEVQVATINNVIYNNGYDYIVVDNIECKGSIDRLINFIGSSDNCIVQNCTLSFAGTQGLYMSGNGCLVDNNKISNTNSAGCYFQGSGIVTLNENHIQNIGLIPGQAYIGEVTDGIYLGIVSSVITYNKIENIGYNGIHGSSGVLNININHNVIDEVCKVLDDGGGMYFVGITAGTKLIEDNVISNVGYNSPSDVTIPRGIYLDEVNAYFIIRNNTIYNCRDGGITVHKGFNNTIEYNTVFNCKYVLHFLASTNGQIYGHTINNNKFIARSASQRAFYYYNGGSDIRSIGTLNNNYYSRPIDNDYIIYTRESTTGYIERDINNWKAYVTPNDSASTSGVVTISSEDDSRIVVNTGIVVKSYQLSATMRDIANTQYSGIITLDPYESIVLFGSGTVTEVEDTPIPEDYITITGFRLNKYSIL